MTIRIASDRTCDLTPEVAEQYGIGIVPCYINVGEKSYLDGVDLSRKDFYAKLPYFVPHPKTSAPGVGMYSAVYQRLAGEGANQIISIHIHSGLSNLANTARLAAEVIDKIKVTVVEAGQLTLGLGFLAIAAAEAARKGKSPDEILKIIKEREARTFVLVAFDTLDYLRASGRAPGLVVSIANLLRIKPIIQLHQGELRLVGQERTTTKSIDHMVNKVKKLGKLERLAVLHTNALEKAEIMAEKLRVQVSKKLDIWISEITPVLGVHIGPGAVGLACVAAE
ncbi:MAG: DegV family protein [Pelolinea sp.]|nr:DegV family protein [Pelolinea sp.]